MLQRDHSMKMKHCDMPMLMVQSAISPVSLPDRRTQDYSNATGTVADHLKRFLYTQETTTTEQQKNGLAPNVREYSGSLESGRDTKSGKSLPSTNQSSKQVRFDIKLGVLELIRETGFDIGQKRQKLPVLPLSARPRSHSNTKILPPLSDKHALKLALNYKRQVLERNRRENTQEPSAEPVAPQPMKKTNLSESASQKPGTIQRGRRLEHSVASGVTSRDLTTISNQDSNQEFVFRRDTSQLNQQAGQILRRPTSFSRVSDPVQDPPRIQRVNLTPQKAPSPPHLSPQKLALEVIYSCPHLFELLNFNPAELQSQVNNVREHAIPAAKRLLHDMLNDHLRKKLINSPADILHKIRCNLRFVALENCLDSIQDLQLLRLRTRKHRFSLRSLKQNDQLKQQILQDIVSRLQQKTVIGVLRLLNMYKRELRDQFESYRSILLVQDSLRKTWKMMIDYTIMSKEEYFFIQERAQRLQHFKLFRVLRAWQESRLIQKAKMQRDEEINKHQKFNMLQKAFRGMQNAVLSQQIKQQGMYLAATMRVNKLQFRVFAGWLKNHRSGNKIRRKALLRLNQGHGQLVDSQSSRQTSADISQRSQNEILSQFLHEKVSETLLIRQNLKIKLDFCLKAQNQPRIIIQRQTHSTFDWNHQPYQQSNITIGLQPHMLRIVSQVPPQVYEQINREVGEKYSVHAALVQQQNLFGVVQEPAFQQSSPVDISRSFQKRSILPQRFQEGREEKMPNQIFKRMQAELITKDWPQESTKILLKNRIQVGMVNIKQMQEVDTPGYHRAQALYMQFKTQTAHRNEVSLSEYSQIALQSGTSLLTLNTYRQQSEQLVRWKIAYLVQILHHDFHQLNAIHVKQRIINSVRQTIRTQLDRSQKHVETSKIKNFYSLFLNWAHQSRSLVYESKKKVRMFKLARVVAGWKQISGFTKAFRNKEEAAVRFQQNYLQTKVLVSLYQNRLESNKVKKFQRRWAFLKFFKRRWLPSKYNRILLQRVIGKAQERHSRIEQPFYQRQYDVMKEKFDRWHQRTYEKVGQKDMMIKNYMALNHYKMTLIFKAQNSLKQQPLLNKKNEAFQSNMLEQVQNVLTVIKDNQDLDGQTINNFRKVWQNNLLQNVFKEWRQYFVKNKIAKMFFKRKYLRALQDHTFASCHQRPFFHYNQRLKVIAFFTLRDFKLVKWQRDHIDLIRSATLGRYEKKLLRRSFNAIIDFVLKSKRKRIVEQTVREFREHAQIQRTIRIWRLYCMLRKKSKLQMIVADEFREDQMRKQIYRGNLQMRMNQATGELVSANRDLQQKAFNMLKKSLKPRHEGRLKQILRAKGQILLVRCFLSWRSVAKFQNSDQSSSMKPTPSKDYQNLLALPSFYQPHDNSVINIGSALHHKFSLQSLVQTSEDSSEKTDRKHPVETSNYLVGLRNPIDFPLLQHLKSLTVTDSFDSKRFTYKAEMFCDTSRSGNEEFAGGNVEGDAKVMSGNSNLFFELDELHRQQQHWEKEQQAREQLYREMALQYNSIKQTLE